MSNIFSVLILLVLCLSCKQGEKTLFQSIPSSFSGITFNNLITESDTFNILTDEYIFNGGGVAVGDFNNDGLPDLFFTGNQVSNKLYLNEGNLQFKDISSMAGVEAVGKWCTGIAVVDINGDGLLDIYVTATMKKDSLGRANMLFVNQGLDEQGNPIFTEQAAQYGIADMGYSMSATFFDYNNDGLLDLYVLNNVQSNTVPGTFREKITDGSSVNQDQLYRNNGNGTFTNVGKEAGITIEGFGLGLAIADFNNDGWPDIYVCNDYLANDLLYINNQDGTFTNEIKDRMRHQSLFSMGVDASDFNNDGLLDVITLDMLAETNQRKKTTISKNLYQTFINNELFGFEYQHVRNMLQLNNGEGIPFSEIGFMAGVYQTDWSWSPLFVDLDNNGYRDLLITNGFPRDITDKDFANYRKDVGNVAGVPHLLSIIPVVKIPNYGFKNNGDLTFSDLSKEWGLDIASFSNGAVFVDLDNDGDMDYVVNNINDEAFVFENTTNTQKEIKGNYLRVELKGPASNPLGIGAKLTINYGDKQMQYHEQYLTRGYLSSVDPIVHFGLGVQDHVQSLHIVWQDGTEQIIPDISSNQLLQISHSEAGTVKNAHPRAKNSPIFQSASSHLNIHYFHQEDDKIDFNLQRTVPHKVSQYGPAIAVGDINGDGLEDFILSGAANYSATAYIQNNDGTFNKKDLPLGDADFEQEDLGLLLFDVDNDGDLDLYVVSGSIEHEPGSSFYQDRLYLNDGSGDFSERGQLPEIVSSGFTVRAADYNADGYLDLFVGGRTEPGKYPYADKSFLLKNDNGALIDVTDKVAPGLRNIGMVTDALWTDFDNDGKVDLMVVGEFMSISFFRNEGDKLVKVENTGIDHYVGWWNSITAGDFNNNGLTDYVVGNLGENNYYHVSEDRPLRVVASDFDQNGSIDPILFAYFKNNQGNYESFPVHFWDDLYGQSVLFRRKYKGYHDYATATWDNLLLPDQRSAALTLEANMMKTCFLENLGNGQFKLIPLPLQAQIAPVNGMLTDDVDGDGFLDILMVGNDYGNEIFAGRHDAFTGLVMKGDGNGNFLPMRAGISGFNVFQDGKALARLTDRNHNDIYLATQNRGELKVYTKRDKHAFKMFTPGPLDHLIFYSSDKGHQIRQELYHGSGFLSQSSRGVKIPIGISKITVVNFKGESRVVNFSK
ncbi:alpha integrin [Anditalea andensis]|uniref:Alpha integrin n=1 Tax=Anditalea andensis TaxID=1048983 RepID=A0A074KWK3_9BACT|nr:alpha integrin [Anditalea andensis]